MNEEINKTYNSLPEEEKEKLNKFEKKGITRITQKVDKQTGEKIATRGRNTRGVGQPFFFYVKFYFLFILLYNIIMDLKYKVIDNKYNSIKEILKGELKISARLYVKLRNTNHIYINRQDRF